MTDIIQEHLEQLDASAETSRQYGFHSRADLFEESASTIRALLDRLEAAERGWQPIETAPLDMTEVLVLIRPKVIRLGWYFAPSSRTKGWRDENNRPINPTHWRPLPDAPAIREVKP